LIPRIPDHIFQRFFKKCPSLWPRTVAGTVNTILLKGIMSPLF
jgi:hypothetical protein